MPSMKPQLKTYTKKWIKEKFNYIATQERRTDSKQLEFIVLQYIKQYEQINGEITEKKIKQLNQESDEQESNTTK